MIAFLIAFLVRASVGSSIVAMTMASGSWRQCRLWQTALHCTEQRCAVQSVAERRHWSHVNDAGFWLVSDYILEIDEKTTLKSWTIVETLIGITGLILGLVISIFA